MPRGYDQGITGTDVYQSLLEEVRSVRQAQVNQDDVLSQILQHLRLEADTAGAGPAGLGRSLQAITAKRKLVAAIKSRSQREKGIHNLRRKAALTQHLCKLNMGKAEDAPSKKPAIPVPAVVLSKVRKKLREKKQQEEEGTDVGSMHSQKVALSPRSPRDREPEPSKAEETDPVVRDGGGGGQQCEVDQPELPCFQSNPQPQPKVQGMSERIRKKYELKSLDTGSPRSGGQPEQKESDNPAPDPFANFPLEDDSDKEKEKEKEKDKEKQAVVANPLMSRSDDESLFPDGPQKVAIDVLVLIAILLEVLLISWMMSVSYSGMPITYIVVVSTLTPVHMYWIHTNFRTAFLTGWILTDQCDAIKKGYLRSWFVFDAFVTVPWDCVLAPFSLTSFTVLTGLRLTRILRVPWLLRRSNPVQDKPVWVQIVLTTFWSIVCVHLATCSWLLIASPEDQGFASATELQENRFRQYIAALYWACATVSSTGYGDISGISNGARVLASVWMWAGVFVIVFFSSKVTQWMVVVDPFLLAEMDKKRQLYALMTHNNIPWKIQKSALSVYPVVLETSSHDYNSIIEELPRFLQDQIRLHVKLKLIRKVPIFKGVTEDCLVAVAQVTVPEFYPQDENVIEYGEKGSEMFFLEHGIVEIYTYNEDGAEIWMANLKGGSFFGEISLMSEDCRRTATVRAVTASVMYLLTKESFDHVVSLYPDLREKVEDQAKSRLDDIKVNLDGIERMKKATRMVPLQPRLGDSEAKKRWKRLVMQVILHRKKAMGVPEEEERAPKNAEDATAPMIGTFVEPINYHPQARDDTESPTLRPRRLSAAAERRNSALLPSPHGSRHRRATFKEDDVNKSVDH